MQNLGYVLLFHKINDDKNTWYNTGCCITVKSFEKMLIEIQNIGVEFCPISSISNGKKPNRIFITFDDGFEDIYLNAYPILKEKKIPFCVFVTTDFIGRQDYLNNMMIKDLTKDSLCTIGSHTISHSILRYHNSGKHKDISSSEEILQSKYYLENILGRTVDLFAYPYGSIYACSLKNIIQVKFAGYKYAFSTLNSHINSFSLHTRYFIPRININESNYKIYLNKLIHPKE